MTISESFALLSFTLFSFADLRYRLVPGIELFFFGAMLLTLPVTPIPTAMIVLACGWGIFRNITGWWAVPLCFYPPAWPILLTGYGYRKGIIGRADLLAVSGLACLFPLPAVLFSFLGLEVWRRIWVRRQIGSIPVLPGILLGMLAYIGIRIYL